MSSLAESLLGGVDRAVELRWDDALRRAATVPGADVAARVKHVTDAFARELGLLGGATGAAAAVPGPGTVASLTASFAEVGWFTLRLADMILTIAALHGHDRAAVEERRAWVLSVLAFGDGAAKGFTDLAGSVGKSGPSAAWRMINNRLRRRVVSRLGTRFGATRAGRLLPLGIGAAVGGTANYVAVRAVARQADRFFRVLPAADDRLLT